MPAPPKADAPKADAASVNDRFVAWLDEQRIRRHAVTIWWADASSGLPCRIVVGGIVMAHGSTVAECAAKIVWEGQK